MPRVEMWLWARKGGRLHFISGDNPKVKGFGDPHNNWFEAMHWPTYGPEFDRILRGVIQSDFPSQGEIEFTAYKGSVGSIQDEFVPNSVISEFLSKHKKYKSYNVRSNPVKKNSFISEVFGKRYYSAKTGEWSDRPGFSNKRSYASKKPAKHRYGKYWIWQDGGVWKTSLDPESEFDSEKDVKGFISSWGKQRKYNPSMLNELRKRFAKGFKKGKRKNSLFEESAEDLAKGFHGREAKDEFDITEQEEYVREQAVIGFLEEIEILGEDLQTLTPINFKHEDTRSAFAKAGKKSDTVFVTFPNRNQIEFRGGDQVLPFESTKKLIEVGPVWGITYWADKYHLSDGKGFSSYHHNFGEESVKGNSEKPSLAVIEKRLPFLPKLVYDTVNCKCLLVGGCYEISDEGIRN